MNDQTLFHNLLVLLKRGQFTLSGSECLMFAETYQGVLVKSQAPVLPKPVIEPIKKEKKVKSGNN